MTSIVETMPRSEITIDLGAIRRNAALLLEALDGAELWAVVKADGYGHGAVNAANGGARRGRDGALHDHGRGGARPAARATGHADRSSSARRPTRRSRSHASARLELVVSDDGPLPEGIPDPPEAGHRHGPLGPVRAAAAAGPGRRPDVPSRDR